MRGGKWIVAVLTLSACWLMPMAASMAGTLPSGTKSIVLISSSQQTKTIGTITFTADGDAAATFHLVLDETQFQDEFLSMRPFKCLPDVKEMWCHLEYPYTLERRIRAADLMDLEYALLFLFKPPSGYGINPWNGLYFKLSLGSDGAIAGNLHEVNLDPLGIIPENKLARIIGHGDLSETDPASHRFARIEIR